MSNNTFIKLLFWIASLLGSHLAYSQKGIHVPKLTTSVSQFMKYLNDIGVPRWALEISSNGKPIFIRSFGYEIWVKRQ